MNYSSYTINWDLHVYCFSVFEFVGRSSERLRDLHWHVTICLQDKSKLSRIEWFLACHLENCQDRSTAHFTVSDKNLTFLLKIALTLSSRVQSRIDLATLLGVILEKEFSHRNKTEIFTNFVAQIPYYKNKNYHLKL